MIDTVLATAGGDSSGGESLSWSRSGRESAG